MDERTISTISRIVLDVQNIQSVIAFYRDVLQLKPVFDPKIAPLEWIEFNTGTFRLALQVATKVDGVPSTYNAIVFYAEDVAAARAELVERGAPMGEIEDDGRFQHCEGHDPEGNRFMISSRPAHPSA
jgi:predicted enzyme related to lactoylglutathione lyase